MDEKGLFVAGLLDATAKAVASGAVERQLGSGPGGPDFTRVAADTEARLAYLSEALAAGAPELFVEHVAWLRDAYAARGASLELLRTNLEALREELHDSLPAPHDEAARGPVDAALAALAAGPRPLHHPVSAVGPHAERAQRFLLALLEARADDALQLVLDALDDGLGLSEIQLSVIAPAQAEMGGMWQRGEVQIAEEHVGSQIVADALTVLRQRIPRPDPEARRVVVASVGGNLHDLGARVVTDHFALAGWRTIFLGADSPGQDVAWTAAEFQADLIAVSVAIALQVRQTAALIETVRGVRPDCPILVGGGPFRQVPELWRAVGADGCAADAPGAVSTGEALLRGT
jgi:methanogenic corrinoid protein MtbC1